MGQQWTDPPPRPAACRAAAAAAPPPAAGAPAPAAAGLLHPVVTTLPSLLGWQPGISPRQQLQQQRRWQHAPCSRVAGGGTQTTGAQPPAASPSRRGYSSLSDSIRITPAIEAQLERIQQRHADLVQQLSGEAMSQ